MMQCQALWSKLKLRPGKSAPQAPIATPAVDPHAPAIERLKAMLDAEPESNPFPHGLEMGPEGATLRIGYLERNQKRFMALVLRSIEEGGLSAIDAGNVVGPKVLIMLNRLRNDAIRSGHSLTLRGILSPEQLIEKVRIQQSLGISKKFDPILPDHWSEQEARDFERAWKELGIEGCDKREAPSGVHLCYFEILVRDGKATFSIKAH